MIVIGGDDNYRDEDEEESVVISRWARRKVASQFDEEYLDGRKSFIFSWDRKHREIHEEALLHFYDPCKTGQKFEYQPRPRPTVRSQEPPVPVDIQRNQVWLPSLLSCLLASILVSFFWWAIFRAGVGGKGFVRGHRTTPA